MVTEDKQIQAREWVTLRHAARIAGVHPNTVRAWVREGTVRSELADGKHGPTYRVALEDVTDLAGSSPSPGSGVLGRLADELAAVGEARIEEARALAVAQARLEELDALRAELDRARDELRALHVRASGRPAGVGDV